MVDNPIRGVSGPGKFSVRTDLPASQNYGDRKAMQEQIAGASTARTADVRGLPTGQVQAAAGPEVMGYAGQSEKLSDILSQMLPYDTDGEIAILYQQAVARGL